MLPLVRDLGWLHWLRYQLIRYRLLHGFFYEIFVDFYHCFTQVLVTVLRAPGSAFVVVLSPKVHTKSIPKPMTECSKLSPRAMEEYDGE